MRMQEGTIEPDQEFFEKCKQIFELDAPKVEKQTWSPQETKEFLELVKTFG